MTIPFNEQILEGDILIGYIMGKYNMPKKDAVYVIDNFDKPTSTIEGLVRQSDKNPTPYNDHVVINSLKSAPIVERESRKKGLDVSKVIDEHYPKTIVVDMDNTLCFTGEGFEDCYPNWQCIEKVNQAYDSGWKVIVDTARGCRSEFQRVSELRELTTRQLGEWGVQYDELRVGVKPSAAFFIDDRAINAIDFIRDGIPPHDEDYWKSQ